MAYLAIFFLSVTLAVCITGVYSRKFHDNWSQALGMISISAWCAYHIWEFASGASVPTELQMLLYAGLYLYATGTFLKFALGQIAYLPKFKDDRRKQCPTRRT